MPEHCVGPCTCIAKIAAIQALVEETDGFAEADRQVFDNQTVVLLVSLECAALHASDAAHRKYAREERERIKRFRKKWGMAAL